MESTIWSYLTTPCPPPRAGWWWRVSWTGWLLWLCLLWWRHSVSGGSFHPFLFFGFFFLDKILSVSACPLVCMSVIYVFKQCFFYSFVNFCSQKHVFFFFPFQTSLCLLTADCDTFTSAKCRICDPPPRNESECARWPFLCLYFLKVNSMLFTMVKTIFKSED